MIKTVSVAPMMDCTDRHEIYFLSLISKNIQLYSEMIVANAIIRGDRNKLLSFSKITNPVALQIGGSNPDELSEACKISEDYGYNEINLNLGCPSKKVEKNKFGACLMKEPNLVADCVSKMQASTKLPVTIKTRIGYDNVEDYENFYNFISILKSTGIKTFIIHARKAMLGKFTPKQNLNIPPLKYDYVYNLKKDFPNEEVIINGGITSVEEINDHLKKIDGVKVSSPMGAFYCIAKLPVDSAEDFSKFLLTDFEDQGQTVMFAPAAGFYSSPELGRDQVRLAFVLESNKLKRAAEILEKALIAYNNL